MLEYKFITSHCEERSDEAIPLIDCEIAASGTFPALTANYALHFDKTSEVCQSWHDNCFKACGVISGGIKDEQLLQNYVAGTGCSAVRGWTGRCSDA